MVNKQKNFKLEVLSERIKNLELLFFTGLFLGILFFYTPKFVSITATAGSFKYYLLQGISYIWVVLLLLFYMLFLLYAYLVISEAGKHIGNWFIDAFPKIKKATLIIKKGLTLITKAALVVLVIYGFYKIYNLDESMFWSTLVLAIITITSLLYHKKKEKKPVKKTAI